MFRPVGNKICHRHQNENVVSVPAQRVNLQLPHKYNHADLLRRLTGT